MKASDERLGNAQVAAMWVSHSSVFQGLFSGDEMSGSGTIINVLCVREKSGGSHSEPQTKRMGFRKCNNSLQIGKNGQGFGVC